MAASWKREMSFGLNIAVGDAPAAGPGLDSERVDSVSEMLQTDGAAWLRLILGVTVGTLEASLGLTLLGGEG
jgi:hypothetical protein